MALGGKGKYFLPALLFDQGEDSAVFPRNILQPAVHSLLGEREDGVSVRHCYQVVPGKGTQGRL